MNKSSFLKEERPFATYFCVFLETDNPVAYSKVKFKTSPWGPLGGLVGKASALGSALGLSS